MITMVVLAGDCTVQHGIIATLQALRLTALHGQAQKRGVIIVIIAIHWNCKRNRLLQWVSSPKSSNTQFKFILLDSSKKELGKEFGKKSVKSKLTWNF